MNRIIIPAYLVAGAALIAGFWQADAQEPVYAAPTGFTITRSIGDDGHDRVTIDVQVTKLLNCDLESGRGPVWIDFSDPDDLGVPPPSPFFRQDGTQAGKTIGKAGDRYWIRGYYALVPRKMRDGDGSWTVNVPCQRWELDAETGKRVWGRKIVARFGPLPLPKPRGSIADTSKGPRVVTRYFQAKDAK